MTIQESLQLYKLPYTVVEVLKGEGYITYKLSPIGPAATISRLKGRLDDIIAATGQPLELLNDSTGVYLRKVSPQVFNYLDYNGYIDYNDSNIPYIVGFNQSGIVLDNLENSRHLLIAGTTGSGKSVFMHDLAVSMLCNTQCIVAFIDIKRVEMSIYKDIATVATEVFSETGAACLSAWFVEQMEERYKLMEQNGVNNFNDLRKLFPDVKRQILIVDELADLIGDKKARKILIPRFLRIAQLGRAAGFHIIIATQRPDSQVINGTLKANMPSRMAFKTLSGIDSRIILDQTGAERLNGSGDGLYISNGAPVQRVQAPYIDLEQIKTNIF